MAVAGLPPGFDIALITGPLLLGYMFSYGLFGILVVQMFIYYTSFPNDPLWMKLTAWGLFFFEILMTVFSTISAWDGLAKGWGDLSTLQTLDWSFDPLPAFAGLLACIVHFFFCWRIYKLTNMIALPIFICGISLTQGFMALYTGVRVAIHNRDVAELQRLTTVVTIWLVFSALADLIITTTLVTVLIRANNKSVFKQTNSTLMKLIKFTVETGMVTSIGATLEVILFLVYKSNNLHFIFFFILSKLYSNTLMATLNSRVIFAKASQGTSQSSSGSQARSGLWDDQNGTRGTRIGVLPPPRPPPKGVQITTRTEMDADLEMVVVSQQPRSDGDIYSVKKDSYGLESDLPVASRGYKPPQF